MRIKGKLVEGASAAAARAAGIGFVTDDRHEEGLFLTLKLRENIGIGALDRVSTAGVIDAKRDYALANEVMQRLGVRTGYRAKEDDDTRAAELSGGNQQKMLIGREIAADPEVILIDEPTKGVDVGARAEIYERLRELADSGVAMVVSSSDGIELAGLCDRVIVFARGQIVKELAGESLTDAAITETNMTAQVARQGGETRKKGQDEGWRRIMAADRFPAAVLAVLTAIVLIGANAISGYFLSAFNIETMLTFLSILAFLSIAQLGTILVGRIDLSVGALAGFVVVLASFLTPDGGSAAQISVGLGVDPSHHRRVRIDPGMVDDLAQHPRDRGDARHFHRLARAVPRIPAGGGGLRHGLPLRCVAVEACRAARLLRRHSDHRGGLRIRAVPHQAWAAASRGRVQSARRDACRHSGQPANHAGFRSFGIAERRRRSHSRRTGRHRFARHRN